MVKLEGCKLEASLGEASDQTRYQFERLGYFCADQQSNQDGKPVFHRTISLRDSWAKAKG
jgi:glutaminyl-tRNA synthetase